MIELFDRDNLTDDSLLRLSNLHAARLLELDAAFGATKLRWLGGEKLLALGKKMADIKGIALVSPPAELQGQLPLYQQEGLSWLQFLREYELKCVVIRAY